MTSGYIGSLLRSSIQKSTSWKHEHRTERCIQLPPFGRSWLIADVRSKYTQSHERDHKKETSFNGDRLWNADNNFTIHCICHWSKKNFTWVWWSWCYQWYASLNCCSCRNDEWHAYICHIDKRIKLSMPYWSSSNACMLYHLHIHPEKDPTSSSL